MSNPSVLPTRKLLTRKKISRAVWGFFLTALILCALSFAGVFYSADRALYDLYLTFRVRHFPRQLDPRILRIDLNDSAEDALGAGLESRQAFADLLFVLSECDSDVAFDFIFRSPAEADAEFAANAREMFIVQALVAVGEEYAHYSRDTLSAAQKNLLRKNLWHIKEHPGGNIPAARTFIMSNNVVSSSAARLGHVSVQTDDDGNFRRTPLFYRWEDGLVPSLPLALAAEIEELDIEAAELFPGRELILPRRGEDSPVRIPVDNEGRVIIPFTASWVDDSYRVSFDRVAQARYNEKALDELFPELAGTITIAADTSTAKQDFGVVPFEAVYPKSGIHTAVLSGILTDFFYRTQGTACQVFLLVVFAALCFVVSLFPGDLKHSAGFALLFAAAAGLPVILFAWKNILPWQTCLCTGVFVCWAFGFIFRLFSRYREQLLLKNALGRYFPRSLAERIAAEGKTELIPAHKELTVLFADIAGFTKWSADKEPDVVHAFLSDYLETLAGIIFDYGGTVDKYMGDGILAFFGDPFDMPDHAARCLAAARAMQAKIAELAAKWKPSAGIDLKVRIGINTGKVIVGNLGTMTRIEYTVIGSAVNLAQRMEASAPEGGVLVTENTRAAAGSGFTFAGKQFVNAKGYDEPVAAYELEL